MEINGMKITGKSPMKSALEKIKNASNTEISITSTTQQKGEYHVKYRYWKKGTCGCTGKEIVRQFKKLPTYEELIDAI